MIFRKKKYKLKSKLSSLVSRQGRFIFDFSKLNLNDKIKNC